MSMRPGTTLVSSAAILARVIMPACVRRCGPVPIGNTRAGRRQNLRDEKRISAGALERPGIRLRAARASLATACRDNGSTCNRVVVSRGRSHNCVVQRMRAIDLVVPIHQNQQGAGMCNSPARTYINQASPGRPSAHPRR